MRGEQGAVVAVRVAAAVAAVVVSAPRVIATLHRTLKFIFRKYFFKMVFLL